MARYRFFSRELRGINPQTLVDGSPSLVAYRQRLAASFGPPPEQYDAFLRRFLVHALDAVEEQFSSKLDARIETVVRLRSEIQATYQSLLNPATLAGKTDVRLRQDRIDLEQRFRELEAATEALRADIEGFHAGDYVPPPDESLRGDLAALADERAHAIDPETGDLHTPRPERATPEDAPHDVEPTLDLDDPQAAPPPRRAPRAARPQRRRLSAEAETAIMDLQRIAGADATRRQAVNRLANRGFEGLLIDLAQEATRDARRYLTTIAGLSDDAVRGVDIVRRFNDEQPGTIPFGTLLDFGASTEGTLVLIDTIAPHCDDSLGTVLKDLDTSAPSRGGPVMQIQGSLGQMLAAQTLLRQHPGAQLSFEIARAVGSGVRRYDIVMTTAAGTYSVEVKTNLTGASGRAQPSSPAGDASMEAYRDIRIHAPDGFRHLIWMFHPDVSAIQLTNIRKAFRDKILGTATRDNADADLRAAGILPVDAAAAFDLVQNQVVQHYDI